MSRGDLRPVIRANCLVVHVSLNLAIILIIGAALLRCLRSGSGIYVAPEIHGVMDFWFYHTLNCLVCDGTKPDLSQY